MWGELSWGEFSLGRVVFGRVVFGASCPDPDGLVSAHSFMSSTLGLVNALTLFHGNYLRFARSHNYANHSNKIGNLKDGRFVDFVTFDICYERT